MLRRRALGLVAVGLLLGGCAPDAGAPAVSAAPPTQGQALAEAAGAAGAHVVVPTASAPVSAAGATAAELAQIDDPASLLVVVNKQRPLKPLDYAPHVVSVGYGRKLRPDAAAALVELMAAAKKDGVPMYPSSAYRSYSEQVTTYAGWNAKMGGAKADALSARAGYSEHQTGLAADMRPSTGPCRAYSTCFGSTPQAAWLAKHAVEYGFIVRYEAGQTAVTGYDPEPWHLRYVGKAFAAEYAASGAHSLEAYFGLPAAPDY